MMKVKMSLVIIISVLFSGMAQAKEKCNFWVDKENQYDEITNLFNGERYSGGKVSGNLCSDSLEISILDNAGLHVFIAMTVAEVDETGNNYYIYPLKKGKLESSGIIKGYYQSGSLLAEIPYKKGIIDGLCKIFYEKNSKQEYAIIPVKNGKKDGILVTYYETKGIIERTLYKNDVEENTTMVEYYKNGNVKAVLHKDNNTQEGNLNEYDENGKKVKEILFKNDKVEKKTAYTYYQSGELKAMMLFESSKPESILTTYYKNGNLWSETSYKNGKREGIEKTYDENGRLWSTLTYVNGEIKSGKCANGRQWTSAELTNWKNGLSVGCY